MIFVKGNKYQIKELTEENQLVHNLILIRQLKKLDVGVKSYE